MASRSPNAPWVPLRVHGHHSLLTGVDSPAALVQRARELKLRALALTDVDSIAGVVEFLNAARDSGVRPIVGAELSDPSGRAGRLVALVRDQEGWRNLCKLVSTRQLGDDPGAPQARLEGPDSCDLVEAAIRFQTGLSFLVDHPRLAYALAERIPQTDLFVAVSPTALLRTTRRGARPTSAPSSPAARELKHPRTPPPERAVSAVDLLGTARALGLEAVAAPDAYWARAGSSEAQRMRVAIKHGALICDLPQGALAEEPGHLLDAQEARAAYAGEPSLLASAWDLAQRCEFVPPLGGVLFPQIELQGEETPYSQLVGHAFDGARLRYRPLSPQVVRRLENELGAIHDLGFAPYFLLVRRIALFAREREIPCVGRGSAADSLVAYCLGLTEADPLRYRLPFERFLNPSRTDRPDIDLDFCWRRRDEVLEAVYDTLGPERTAQISTLNRLGLRAAFREASRALGIPTAEVERWSRRLPWAPVEDAPEAHDGAEADAPHSVVEEAPESPPGVLERALRATPEGRDFPFEDARMRAALAAADELHGKPRHFGLHPGGVVVAPGAITDFVACQRAAKGPVVTQLDKDGVEALGLVKMDLLGNRALTVLHDCLNLLRERGIEPDLEQLPESDPLTASLLRTGRTLGCFQVESPGMRHLLQQMGARCMDDVIQSVALIRPGPAACGMKDAYVRRFRGLEEPRPPHPRLAELLRDTRGVMLYQEDVMQTAKILAGMNLGEADRLRRALTKRRGDEVDALRERFFQGAQDAGIDSTDVSRVWELVVAFASFGFCKAHAVTYGRIAYRTVYLKAHWPAEFLVSFLQSETGYYEARVYVEEARRLGVTILGPDVNRSDASFSLEDQALRIGLGQLRGLSEATLERLLSGRERGGPYLSLPDFLERVHPERDEAEGLVQCGAFDAFDRTRPELLWRLHLLLAPPRRPPRASERGAEGPLDPLELAACNETPEERARRSGGWARASIGLGAAALAPSEARALFPEPEAPALALPQLPDLDPLTRGRLEFEHMGLTVRTHPVQLFGARTPPPPLRRDAVIPCARVPRFVGGRVSVQGWVAATRRVRTADGRWMRFLTLEDESGVVEGVLFPPAHARWGHRLASRGPFYFTGVVQDQLGACALAVESIR